MAIVLVTCDLENNKLSQQITLNTSNTMRYYNSKLLSQARDFVEINHQNSKCANDLLKEIFSLYLFIDEVYNRLVEESGGYNNNGELISINRDKLASLVISKSDFKDKLKEFDDNLKNISKEEGDPFLEIVTEKIRNDLTIFSYQICEDENLDEVSVGQFYSDLILIKSSLLFTEIMYFEMLKSTDC